jgi:hypothetical protein
MPGKKGKKFRTVKKFQGRRKRSKNCVLSERSEPIEPDQNETSVNPPTICASARKLSSFKRKRDSDHDIEEETDQETKEDAEADYEEAAVHDSNLNFIMSLDCLQTFIDDSNIKCSFCRQRTVSSFFFIPFTIKSNFMNLAKFTHLKTFLFFLFFFFN